MRFCNCVIAVTVALLATTNAVATDIEQNHVSQATATSTSATQTGGTVKRSLRSQAEEFLDVTDEERHAKGVNVKQLRKALLAKGVKIPTNIKNLTKQVQKELALKLKAQNLTKKKFATKLGMRDVDDVTHMNYPFYQKWEHLFLPGKKPKKIPEAMIGNHEYYF